MTQPTGNWREVARLFARLGVTSFGGPVAHIGYFREAVVTRRGWLDEARFAELLALCQFLPGPASSQLGFAIGYQRAGIAGALAAFVAFTLPSALLLVLLAAGLGAAPAGGVAGAVIQGLKITAVAVVAHAVWGMARQLAPSGARAGLALAGLVAMSLWAGSALAQIAVIAAGGMLGLALGLAPAAGQLAAPPLRVPGRRVALSCLAVFAVGLLALPVLGQFGTIWALADSAWRAGALVFGGGHVVLPLLESGTVGRGLVSADGFVAGYGAAQAVPGPLFTFAGWLGQLAAGPFGALVALVAIFAPGFLLLMAAMPFWAAISAASWARHALAGANAAVVGILAAAFYDPVFTAAVTRPPDFALAVALSAALILWRRPAWEVVIAGALGGLALSALG